MTKTRYSFKYKYISVRLFKEENMTITDGILIDLNIDTNALHIYSKLTISGRYVATIPICYDFTNKCDLKERIRNEIENNPFASARDIRIKTGHSLATVTRYYMALKRELGYLRRTNKNIKIDPLRKK